MSAYLATALAKARAKITKRLQFMQPLFLCL